MLATILKSTKATETTLAIIDAFTKAREIARTIKPIPQTPKNSPKYQELIQKKQCDSCHGEQLVAFSCKRRGFCPSCGAKRMVESAALLVDELLPEKPIRQWVLSVPYPLR